MMLNRAISRRVGTVLCFGIAMGSAGAGVQIDCSPDLDADGHPVFGVTALRADLERIDGIQTGATGTSIALADIDADGDLDAITCVNRGLDSLGAPRSHVAVLRNRGDGVFDGPERYDLGEEEVTARVGDFNRDGHPDIAVAIAMDDACGILINRGDGTFEPTPTLSVGVEPRSLIVGDFDADGDDDLCVINTGTSDVSIFLSNGDATFSPEVRVAVPRVSPRGNGNRNFPFPGAHGDLGDLNADGWIDLVVPASREAYILLGDGRGGFTPAKSQPRHTGGLTYHIRVRDIDHDGDLDLCATVANGIRGLFVVWKNDGAGGFADRTIYDTSFFGDGFLYNFVGLAMLDIDGDGDLDMVQGGEAGDYAFSMRNNGDGTFSELAAIEDGSGPWVLDGADINGDGLDDAITFSETLRAIFRSRLASRIGSLHGVQAAGEEQEIRDVPLHYAVAAADLDNDGDDDVIAGESGLAPFWSRRLTVLRNDGDAGLTLTHELFIEEPTRVQFDAILAIDADADGLLDIVAAGPENLSDLMVPGRIWVLSNLGNMRFSEPWSLQTPDSIPESIASGDFDGDGDVDIAVFASAFVPPGNAPREHRVQIYSNDGGGRFEESARFLLGLNNNNPLGGIGVGDADGDGDLDVITAWSDREIEGPAWLLRNAGDGSFTQEICATLPPFTRRLAMGDFDEDGDLDFAIIRKFESETIPYLAVYFNDGTGAFTLDQSYIDVNVWGNAELVAYDVNLDGALDLIIAENNDGIVVHLNDGGGDFSSRAQYSAFGNINRLTIGNFTGDRRPDAVGSSDQDRSLVIMRGIACLCPADLSGSMVTGDRLYGVADGILDTSDFFFYLDAFARGDLAVADLTGSNDPGNPGFGVPDGLLDAEDFHFYLALFAEGC